MYTYIHAYIGYHTYIHTYLLTYIHTYIISWLITYIITYRLTYILTCIHTYIHTYQGYATIRQCLPRRHGTDCQTACPNPTNLRFGVQGNRNSVWSFVAGGFGFGSLDLECEVSGFGNWRLFYSGSKN